MDKTTRNPPGLPDWGSGPNACRFCGSRNLFEVRCESGPHYARIGCAECGRNQGFLPKPWTPERAAAFTLPFGKFRGKTVGELAKSDDGLRYLAWLADNVEGNAARAARIILGVGRADS